MASLNDTMESEFHLIYESSTVVPSLTHQTPRPVLRQFSGQFKDFKGYPLAGCLNYVKKGWFMVVPVSGRKMSKIYKGNDAKFGTQFRKQTEEEEIPGKAERTFLLFDRNHNRKMTEILLNGPEHRFLNNNKITFDRWYLPDCERPELL
ncbi:hypothetical protein RUM43_012974 [Polyplax serrata]|uniref:Uncharacterized protein n=1 Tax=Polyplax serrata TaxID=468196 RepID=A0AAN8NJK8_POLSC